MRLHTSPASPFGRKVKVVAIEKGILDRIEILNQQVTPIAPSAAVIADGPLGKIPCLITDDGTPLYDSRVICEYLDSLAERPRLIPAAGPERFAVLTLGALGDGLLDPAVLPRYEPFLRPEPLRWADWVSGQKQKVMRALDWLEDAAARLAGRIDIGTLTVGCALGYLDFRYADDGWRTGRPRLAAWYETMAGRTSLLRTLPS